MINRNIQNLGDTDKDNESLDGPNKILNIQFNTLGHNKINGDNKAVKMKPRGVKIDKNILSKTVTKI